MSFKSKALIASALSAGVLALGLSAPAAAADEAAAKTLAKQSGCLKCHAVDKKKDGPAYKEVAAKYKGKADAVDKLTHHVTSGEKVKFEDGHEEEHKIVKSKDPAAIKNLVEWILSL
ncbi:MAG: hypothetical protein Fur0039_09790 [Rhodocyclaceae bacterium]